MMFRRFTNAIPTAFQRISSGKATVYSDSLLSSSSLSSNRSSFLPYFVINVLATDCLRKCNTFHVKKPDFSDFFTYICADLSTMDNTSRKHLQIRFRLYASLHDIAFLHILVFRISPMRLNHQHTQQLISACSHP